MTELTGKRIVLGVTGGIAAYKAAELARLLTKGGARVDVVLTEAGAHFVGAATFQALTGQPVWSDLWDQRMPNGMAHIDLTRGADAILVAPASADFMARLAQGRADNLLATLCLARECPLLVAPAMNRQMWENPATQRNVAQLAADGVTLLGPASGEQACGVDVRSAAEMREAVLKAVDGCDIFIAVAAVADYRPAQASPHKLKKGNAAISMELLPNPDILAEVAALPNAPFCVGFAAESQNLAAYAEGKRQAKKLPLVVGNLVQDGLGGDSNTVVLFDADGSHALPPGEKSEVARGIVAHIALLQRQR
ncbi:MAG: bifunctional phosphopantothenoylcysteine decarboxylase/phosphopantothenate synthase [Proteobacteria bacterium]|nr:bifunctional phosphopantothenoylcysteine decarboxylase/phosphopantothenate synthase [Pseudomonadota bacterium]